MAKNKAVVVGALGVIGRKLTETLGRRDDWEIVGLSRRTPDFDSRASYISLDLLDRADAEAKLAGLTDVTHVFYCAFQARPVLEIGRQAGRERVGRYVLISHVGRSVHKKKK